MTTHPPVRVGVIGAGWGAGLHLEGYRRTNGVVLSAITSRTPSTAEQLARDYGVEQVVDNVEELIELVDVVSVATPPDAHLAPTLAAIAADKHVLCDKPLALDAAEAATIVAAAEAAGVRHATGFIWRLDPSLTCLREALRRGTIGTVREVDSTCALGVPVMPHNWMYERSHGGGALMQHGSHVIDRVRWLLGSEIAKVVGRLHHDVKDVERGPAFHNVREAFTWSMRPGADAAPAAPRVPVDADSGYEFVGETAGGVRVRFWEAWHLLGRHDDRLVVYGDRGTLEWIGGAGVRLLRHRREPESLFEGSAASGANTPEETGWRLWGQLAETFLASIRGEPSHAPTLEDGWQVMRVIDAVRRSDASGCWETV
jgi:predicted dehydrogenase